MRSAAASASLFSTLGVQPVVGRLPSEAEDCPGKQPVVLLTEALWRRRFAADPGILGRPVTIDGQPLVVVGVLPESFVFQSDPEFWTTFEDNGDVTTRANRYLDVVARMRPGVYRRRRSTRAWRRYAPNSTGLTPVRTRTGARARCRGRRRR